MGTSTDGQICFGIEFEEGFEFPWDELGDIDDWWTREVQGFRHSFEIYDDNGEYLNGARPEQDVIDRYYEEQRKFKEENPKLPVELVNYCSGSVPMYILAVPRTSLSCRRGYPIEFDPSALMVTEDEKEALLQFCKDHGLEHDAEPKWLLSSYRG